MWEKEHPVWDKYIYFEIMDIPASTGQVVTPFSGRVVVGGNSVVDKWRLEPPPLF